MTIIDRYIVRTILAAVAVVLLVLMGLGAFIEMVGQLDDVGTANYGLPQAVTYVALRLPRMAFEMLPAAALLGALLGLGGLASHSELIVMRASGVSRARLLSSAGLAGLILVVLMGLLGESIAPTLGQYARQLRATSLLDDLSIGEGQEIWLRDGDWIVNLQQLEDPLNFGGIVLFGKRGQTLSEIAEASYAEVDDQNRWLLRNFSATRFNDDGVTTERDRQSVKNYPLKPDILGLSVVRPNLLDTQGLWRYIGYLKGNALDPARYQIAFWTRIANVFSVGVMVVLALPFVFGSLRSAGTGARILVGLMIGLGYYLATRMLESSGEVFNLDPLLVAWAPTAVLLLITCFGLLRIR